MADIDPKELLKEFTAASWHAVPEMNDYVRRAMGVADFPLKKAFEVLCENGHISNPAIFKKRIYCFELIANASKNKEIGEYFIESIPDAPASVQQALLRILKEINDPVWHHKALKMLNHKDVGIRKIGKELCMLVGGKTMFQLLAQQLKNKTLPPRGEVLEILAQIAGHHSLTTLKEIYPGTSKVERINILNIVGNPKYMQAAKREAANFLVECCQDKETMVVKTSVRMLGKIGSKDHVPVLMDLGSEPDSPYFEEVIQSVGALAGEGNIEVIELLAVVMRGHRANLQLAAVDALYKIGSNEVLPPLCIGLRDSNLQVRQRAADSFVKLAKEQRVEIGRLLVFLMKERDANVRRIAVEIIDSVGATMPDLWRSLVSYLKDADWWVRERVTDVLVSIGGDKIAQHLMGLLQDPKEIVRRYAIEVLVRIKNKTALPQLLQAAINDSDWWVRERAIEAVGLLEERSAVPQLIKLLAEEELRWVTVKALGQLKDPLATPHLVKFLAEGEPEFRLDVLDALQAIGDRGMLDTIIQLQYDINRDIREKAVGILKAYQVDIQGEQDFYKKVQNLSMLDKLLLQTKKRGGTDLFLHSGSKPYIRYLSDVIPVSEQLLTNEQVVNLIKAVLPQDKEEELEKRGDADFSYQIEGEKSRFRVNIYKQRNGLSAVFRVINDKVTPIEQLGFSKHVVDLTQHHQGMILVTGPAGSGKTTTLMAMIDYINRNHHGHIITMEDPVEYIVESKNCLVNQREVGRNTMSFASGLRAALREDPDVILIGEMRDMETFSIAIKAAETGHLVLGTLHTLGAAATVDRLIDAFPHEQQAQIRSMVSESLKGVVSQQLVKKKDGSGRILVTEVMMMNDAIANLIRKEKNYQIATVIGTGIEMGMHLMDMELKTLVDRGVIGFEDALVKAVNKKEFETYFSQDPKAKEKPKAKDVAASTAKPASAGNPNDEKPPIMQKPGMKSTEAEKN